MLDFSLDADELPIDVDDALDADEVLSAQAGAAVKAKVSAAAPMARVVKEWCMYGGSSIVGSVCG